MTANERQVGGAHYKVEPGKEEHWDRVARLKLNYFEAQITKYVERCRKKLGVEDLKKAGHFLEKYIELWDAGVYTTDKVSERKAQQAGREIRVTEIASVSAMADGSEPGRGYVDQDR